MKEKQSQAVEIPPTCISAEALDAIIETFILREGTDYGLQEVSLAKKKEQIHRQLKNQDIVLVFDTEAQSPQLLPKKDWQKLQKAP